MKMFKKCKSLIFEFSRELAGPTEKLMFSEKARWVKIGWVGVLPQGSKEFLWFIGFKI